MQTIGDNFYILFKPKNFPAEWKKANVVPVYKKRDHMLKTTD